jgi:hypothetical protein
LIKKYVSDMDQADSDTEVAKNSYAGRDDLVICASLSLGNLARRGELAATPSTREKQC